MGLLSYYISADAIIQFPVNTSVSSFTSRTKWIDLAEFEGSLASIKNWNKI